MADFQQYYHLNLWDLGLDSDIEITTAEVRRAAILATQLPRDSRVMRAMAPEASHGLDVLLLREIEHNQRLWHWANTEQAKDSGTQPEPISLPGEDAAYQRASEEADRRAEEIAASFGMRI